MQGCKILHLGLVLCRNGTKFQLDLALQWDLATSCNSKSTERCNDEKNIMSLGNKARLYVPILLTVSWLTFRSKLPTGVRLSRLPSGARKT